MDKKKILKGKIEEIDTVNERTLMPNFFNIRTDNLPTGSKKGVIKRALYKVEKKKEDVQPAPVAPMPEMPQAPAGGGNEAEWTNNSQKYGSNK